MRKKSIAIIIVAGCILTLPIIFHGAPFASDDGLAHARWYIHFSEQFWAGDLYPRWLVGMNNGLGSPVFFYYPPVPFWLTSLIRPFFSDDPYGWHQLGVSASFAMILSGFCAYLWLKQIVKETPALITAVLYMAGPYHLASDVYIRFSFAELWSFVWMPLILYFTHKLSDGDRLAIVGLSISYSLLIMTHLPTTLIFSIVPLCYVVILRTDHKLITFGKVVISMALGIGLSAIYLYPAMAMQKYVFLDRMGIGYFSYQNWLFFSNFELWTEDKITILLMVLDLFGIACCAFIISRKNSDPTLRKLGLFWLFTAIGSVMMMTELSKPIWLIFYPLHKIQFPFRFCITLTLAVTALIALALSAFRNGSRLRISGLGAIIFLLIAAWLPASVWAIMTAFPLRGTDQKTISSSLEESRDAPEYRPRWNESMNGFDWDKSKDIDDWDAQTGKEYHDLLQRIGATNDNVSKVNIAEGAGQAEIISWKPREIVLEANTDGGMEIYVDQFYFPNWKAQIDGERHDATVQPSRPDGLISLSIPNGHHQVRLSLEKSPEELTGQTISLASLILLLIGIALFGLLRLHR